MADLTSDDLDVAVPISEGEMVQTSSQYFEAYLYNIRADIRAINEQAFGDTDAYTATNVTTDRDFDANTVAIAELADVVGTLIADLKAKGIIT